MAKSTTTRLLFVYGTLKRGGELHNQLIAEGACYRGSARIKGRLFRLNGESYPGAVPTRSPDFIYGELYELEAPSEALKKVDELEGLDEGLFVRKRVNTWGAGDQRHRAWAYFYAQPLENSRRIPSGRFPVRTRATSGRARHSSQQ